MQRATSTVLFALLTAAAGCGPSGPVMHEVHGTVSLGGKPVPGAQVQFVPDQKGTDPASAVCDAAGVYRVQVSAGEHTVRILAQKLVPAPKGLTGPYGAPIEKVTADLIPPRYNARSELRATVEGPTEKNFDLQPN